MAVHDARREPLDGREGLGLDGALAVHGVAQRIHHPAHEGAPDRHLGDASCPPDLVSFLDESGLPHQDGPNGALFQVQRYAPHFMRQVEELTRHHFFQSMNASDPVSDRDHRPDLVDVHGPLETLDLLPEDLAQLFQIDRHPGIPPC